MKAIIKSHRPREEGFDISKLKTTLTSLEKHKFSTVFFYGLSAPIEDIDLLIVPGMTVESLRGDGRAIVNHGGYRVMLSHGFKSGANLLRDNLLIGYGLCDRCACLSLVSKETVKKMLHPVSEYM